MHGHHKLAMIINGIGHYAEIDITVVEDGLRRIGERCHGAGWLAQGYIEDVPQDGYDDWKNAALSGVVSAFRQADVDQSQFSVWVDRIQGLATDTNPRIVACAATMAVWDALGWVATDEQLERIKNEVAKSWDLFNAANKALHRAPTRGAGEL
jgi:hypothetical protein